MTRALRTRHRAVVAAAGALGTACACPGAGSGVLNLGTRLEALSPEAPLAYFLLAEEVASEQPEEHDLARTLYVLAFELERRREPAGPLAPGVCLALADISRSDEERLWLRSLAGAMSLRGASWTSLEPEEPPAADAFTLAEALGQYRAGENRRALDLLESPGVARLFEEWAAPLPGGTARILDELRAEAQCRRCRNKRVTSAGEPEVFEICSTCAGDPGPDLTDAELIEHLRVESALLRGAGSTWSAQLALDRARPLRDIDPAELAPWFRVDPAKTLFRNGAWTEPAAPPSPQGHTAPDPAGSN